MSWRDSIQKCKDVPVEVCHAKYGGISGDGCDECAFDRVIEALKAKGTKISSVSPQLIVDTNRYPEGWVVVIPEEQNDSS